MAKKTEFLDEVFKLLKSDNYAERAKGEYMLIKDKYDKLHKMIVKREAGTITFEPNCPMWQWLDQAEAMGEYLHQLEIKAEMEGIEL